MLSIQKVFQFHFFLLKRNCLHAAYTIFQKWPSIRPIAYKTLYVRYTYVIKEKKVFVKDPELESKVFSYEEENKHLKEELEKTYYVNQKLIKEKEDMMKVTSTREESSTDTVTKKKRKFKLFSD